MSCCGEDAALRQYCPFPFPCASEGHVQAACCSYVGDVQIYPILQILGGGRTLPLLEPASEQRSKIFLLLVPRNECFGGGLAFAFFARVPLGRSCGSPDGGMTFLNRSSP